MNASSPAAAAARYRPIGWYLKELDRLITEVADRHFARKQLTRFHWQILTTVHCDGPTSIDAMYPGVRNFVSRDELVALFDALIARGWLTPAGNDGNSVVFSPLGRSEYAGVVALQQEFLKLLMGSVGDADYQTTVATLARMVDNLGGAS